MTSLSRERRMRWDLNDFTVLYSLSCVEMRAFFHRKNRLRSTFSKDGIRGSLHLAAANAISALLSSGARATDPRNGARNACRDKEKHWENRRKTVAFPSQWQFLAETFLFDTEKLSTSVNPRIIAASIYSRAKYLRGSDCSTRYSF